jgi:hypothetical protein
MRMLILGLDHAIQKIPGNFPNPRKDRYEGLVKQLVKNRTVEFIGEEAYPNWRTIAKRIAGSLNGVHWEAIEMSLEQRDALGITEDQNSRPSDNVRVLSDPIREAYMVWRAIMKAGAVQSSMILCGRLHTEELGERFRKAGHDVRTDDLLKYGWYRESK